jgi:hypothetical protein
MGMYGDLNDFALTDMLAMIAQRGKSGTLRLSTATDRITLSFDRGVISAVSSGEINQHIGRLLVRHGYVREEQVEQGLVLQALSTPRRRLGEVLVDIGAVTRRQVADAVASQLKSSLVRLLIEPIGTFAFTPSEADGPAVVRDAENRIDSVMREALQLAGEWLENHPERQTVAISDDEVDPNWPAELSDTDRTILLSILNGSTELHTLALESSLPFVVFDESIERLRDLHLIQVA